jgi:hypothetical protein
MEPFPRPLPSIDSHGRARRYSPAEWETLKPRIEELYVKEQRTMKEVITLMKEIGFAASYVS